MNNVSFAWWYIVGLYMPSDVTLSYVINYAAEKHVAGDREREMILNDSSHVYGQTCQVEHTELWNENEMKLMKNRIHQNRHKTQVNESQPVLLNGHLILPQQKIVLTALNRDYKLAIGDGPNIHQNQIYIKIISRGWSRPNLF